MSAEFDTWQVWSEGTVYEADYETLRQWIIEGCVLPTDKVRKGNLRWIEAGRAPSLRAIFNGEAQMYQETPEHFHQQAPQPAQPFSQAQQAPAHQQSLHQTSHQQFQSQESFQSQPAPPPYQQPYAEQSYSQQPYEQPHDYAHADDFAAQPHAEAQFVDYETAPPPPPITPAILTGAATCYNHAGVPPKFICRMCSATFCAECPKFVGGSRVPICALCGDLCKPFEELQQKVVRQQFRSSGFGFTDLGHAFAYPFKHFWALLGGSILYSILMFGGIKGQLLGSAILLGTLCMVIKQSAWGKLDRPFLPDISAFSMWDDLFVPIGLSIGIYIITFGPTFLLLIVMYLSWFTGPSPISMMPSQAEQQSAQLTQQDVAALADQNNPEATQKALQKLDRNRPANQINSAVSRMDQAEHEAQVATMRAYISMLTVVPIWMWLLLLLSLLWAIFYFPMALSIAGFTEDFWSVVNPKLGLSTMRDMGLVYVKVFFMYLAIQFVEAFFVVIIRIVTSPFDVPLMGNIPGNFISNTISYYFSIVVACVLGLALFKCADKLEIQTD
ncbi:MAG TPA: hypothetical protein VK619_04760 [Pyrinomonadaceae bacterium]|nr:hypothetical protein [Pyrinomonadaceae bacterium]